MKKNKFYFHIGLPKTGTTFLQKYYFSKIDINDINYLEKTYSTTIWDIINFTSNKYLISSEHLLASPFDCERGEWLLNFKKNLIKLNDKFPNSKYILTVRNHDKLILSYYKEFISKGNRAWYPKLESFFNLNDDSGQVSRNDFFFKNIINEIIKVTGSKPLVFSQEELKKDPQSVFRKIENFCQIPKQKIHINSKSINYGVNLYQSKIMLILNRLNLKIKNFGLSLYSPFFVKFGLTPDYICRKRLRFISARQIVFNEKVSKKIKSIYYNDLKWVEKYIKEFKN